MNQFEMDYNFKKYYIAAYLDVRISSHTVKEPSD